MKNIIVRPNGDHGSAKIFLAGKHGPCTRCDSEEKRQPAHRPPWRLPTLPPAQSSCQQQCQRVCRARGRQRLGHRPCRSFQKGSTRCRQTQRAHAMRACGAGASRARGATHATGSATPTAPPGVKRTLIPIAHNPHIMHPNPQHGQGAQHCTCMRASVCMGVPKNASVLGLRACDVQHHRPCA